MTGRNKKSLMLHNLQINFTYDFTEPLRESKGLILFEIVGNGGSQKWSDSFLKVTQVVHKKLGLKPSANLRALSTISLLPTPPQDAAV